MTTMESNIKTERMKLSELLAKPELIRSIQNVAVLCADSNYTLSHILKNANSPIQEHVFIPIERFSGSGIRFLDGKLFNSSEILERIENNSPVSEGEEIVGRVFDSGYDRLLDVSLERKIGKFDYQILCDYLLERFVEKNPTVKVTKHTKHECWILEYVGWFGFWGETLEKALSSLRAWYKKALDENMYILAFHPNRATEELSKQIIHGYFSVLEPDIEKPIYIIEIDVKTWKLKKK